jgi:glycosyltransferase involved in cell wall biosynthesis
MVGGQETGNETYVRGLVEGFKNLNDQLDLVVFNIGSPWTSPNRHVRFQKLITGHPYVRLGIELPLRSSRDRLDVMHMTYTAPVWSAAPIVLTVHDICYATNPEWFSPRDLRVLSNMVPRSIRKATHVITDSQDARRQIIEQYRVPETKISAIPIGPGPGAEQITRDAAQKELVDLGLDPTRRYVLTVGNLQPRKNLIRLVEAFNQVIAEKGHDLDLVIVGPRHYRADEIVEAAQTAHGRIRFTGYVSDRQLAACYRCSTVFALPSLYEGFGLPVIEAMAHGIPVACSNVGALPEVSGDAALLFDPLRVDEMVAAIDKILSDDALRERLSQAGKARAAEFSWVRAAEQTLKVYESAAGGAAGSPPKS